MKLLIDAPRHSPTHRAYQAVGYGLIAGAALLVAFTQPNYQLLNFSKVGAYAVALLGINIVTGYSGQISLGHSAFFGIGAYTTAYLVADKGWPFLATLPVAALLGLVIGLIVGLPALRIQGLYLALVTLAIAAVFPVIVKMDALTSITGGPTANPCRSTGRSRAGSASTCRTKRGSSWSWPPSPGCCSCSRRTSSAAASVAP